MASSRCPNFIPLNCHCAIYYGTIQRIVHNIRGEFWHVRPTILAEAGYAVVKDSSAEVVGCWNR